ncbi:hypothetical protein FJZ18_02430 [Candidatus Pacearchaeota archaeon]|nr:hypothetical protein [Candidatus Pacearchaeota archaeon]
MESTIYKIFSGKTDESVHAEFIKYSKGIFENKYLLEGKKSKTGWTIKTSAEYVNTLVRNCLEKSAGRIQVSGVIVSTFDVHTRAQILLGNETVKRVKQFMGIKQVVIEGQADAKNLIELMDSFPRAFFALSFSSGDTQIKTKAKAPKSAKPSSGGDKEVSADFCTVKTNQRGIIDDLFFDCKDFIESSIRHTLSIKEITLPKGVSDPVQIREQAKRKGTIIRILKSDGKETKKEVEFEA